MYYSVFMIYPFKGSSYPKATLTHHHPFYEWINIAKYAKNEVPVKDRPYKIMLTFWKEVDPEAIEIEKYKERYDLNNWQTLVEEYDND